MCFKAAQEMFSKGPNCTQAFWQTKRMQIPQPCMPSFCSPVAAVYSRSRITASWYLRLHAFHTSRDQTHNRQFRVSCPPDLDSYGRRGSATQQHCRDKHVRQRNIKFPLLHLMRALKSRCVCFLIRQGTSFFAIVSPSTNSFNLSVQFEVHQKT